jgi:hypothetical protein
MSEMQHKNHLVNCSRRRTKLPWICLLLCLASMRAALATTIPLGPGSGSDPNGPNNAVLNYLISGSPPPLVDATAFDNENFYGVSFTVFTANPVFYETWNTVNYTNNGTMVVNSPIVTNNINGIIFISQSSPGCGFRFDTQTTNVIPRQMAGTFYNPGTIRCDSILDGNNVLTFDGFEEFFLDTVGEFIVSATNVVNPGTVDVGLNGLIQITGQNVDLSRSTLTVESLQNLFLNDSVGVNGSGGFGLDTNADWDPTFDLGPTFAEASFPDQQLFLTNSTSYFQFDGLGTSNVVIRAVFVQNNNPNVPYNVYIDPSQNINALDFAAGAAHVEWVGSYLDPATGTTTANYLYLTDDYALGATTNVVLINGVPDNFTFVASATPLLIGPTPAGFQNVFVPGALTNRYSYFNAQLIPTATPTNASIKNPSGALTNLVGCIQIMASQKLNLANADISGMNYMSLTSTNQFDGNIGDRIAAPFSDINLGVTNGSLAITNLLESALPEWTGSVQAWSTRWLTVTNGVTNDFRVLIVNSSQLQPVTQPQVQSLKLHATNSLVISDVLNVFGSLNIDAQNLTLTTNIIGNGAQSLDGELNLESPSILWASTVPNLRNLTNNGAIRTQNLAAFGSAQANCYNFINTGLIADQGAQIWANNFNSSGTFSNISSGGASFTLQSTNTVLTNGLINANGNVSITTGSLLTSNLVLQAGRSLTLSATNLLTDTGVTNGNIWTVGAVATTGSGLSLPFNPTNGDLLGTTITNIAPINKNVIVTWAGNDYGAVNAGFTNNVAVGQLVLDAFGTSPQNGQFTFKGTGVSNAIYVDELVFADSATNETSYNMNALSINTNITIYFAQAMLNGVSVAEKIDTASRQSGKNGGTISNGVVVIPGRLLWVPTYVGHFSSTNIIYPDGSTNTVNAALAQSLDDSDGDGINNASDTTPFFLPDELNFTETLTNVPPLSVKVQWATIPNGTNYIYYRTNLVAGGWLPFTNFNSYYYGNNLSVTNAAHTNNFASPQPYPGPATNVWIFDVITNQPHYYRVLVQPWLTYPN